VLDSYHFYDPNQGDGIWGGKHYGKGDERYGDPIGNHSHAATVRQLLRFYLMLEQGRLVSPEASRTMLEIFESPEFPTTISSSSKGSPDAMPESSANGDRGKPGCMTRLSSAAQVGIIS
jgi:beta-lactamase class A